METCYRHPDRETALSCSDCGRPICTDCMTMAPVGLRCPDHSGRPQGVQKVTRGVRRASFEGTGALVTKALIGINVAVYALALATGADMNRISGPVLERGSLVIEAFASNGEVVGLATGEWWRLLTSTFIHAGLFHLGINMLILWLVGGPLEEALGRGRFILLYLASGLAGSAGALLLSPNAVTVGASGAIFGIFGAALVLERVQGLYVLGGSVVGLVVLNLVFTFAFARFGISVGGHLGGFAGGALCALALSRLGRAHAAYGRPGALGFAGLVAVGVLSVAVAVLQVQRFA